MNPRVLLWLKSVNLTPADIKRAPGADTPIVEVAGERNLWTVFFSLWITKQWARWAAELGYKHGLTPWRECQADGATDAQFDVWLEKECKGGNA